MAEQIDVIQEFREDHRKVRDGLLDISDALAKHDIAKSREILGELNTLVGPHFRYEEETLYPTLKRFLGEYVDQLLQEHDGVINTAKNLAQFLNKMAYLCPESQCPKFLRNGACGGSEKTRCEVRKDKPCVWVKIYDRLKAAVQESNLKEGCVPPRNWALNRTSSRGDFL